MIRGLIKNKLPQLWISIYVILTGFCFGIAAKGRVGNVDALWSVAAGHGVKSGLLGIGMSVVLRAVGKVVSVISAVWLLCWSWF